MARDFYNYYQAEAVHGTSPRAQTRQLGWFFFKATGIYLTITIIVYLLVNYEALKLQLIDAKASEVNTQTDLAGDSDGDGIPDWWEIKYGLNSNDVKDAMADYDNDGAPNILEFQFNTDPFNPDSDNDGYFDGEEIRNGNNPNGTGRIDSDGDGIYDWWEEQYGLDKNNPADAEDDFDQDDLANKQEFIYNTNPRDHDTDKDGISDGQEVEAGRSPIGEGSLEEQLKKIDLNDEDQDGLSLEYETFFGTNHQVADSDSDGYDDFRELSRGYDPLGNGFVQGELIIPALNVQAPIIWSQSVDESEIMNDLESGLIHYPGSAFPGFKGNSYITGHSSYYTWSKSSFKDILKDLEKLKVGDEVIFSLTFTDGHSVRVIYEVTSEGEVVTPYDRRIFQDSEEKYELTLVTCWPLGSNWKRIMVKGKLKSPKFQQENRGVMDQEPLNF